MVDGLTRLGYSVEGDPYPTGRPDRWTLAVRSPDGDALVAKVFPNGDGELTFANMKALWESSFGARRDPPGLPRPVELLADLGVLLMERIEGRPMVELAGVAPHLVDGAISLVADLHRSDAQPPKRRTVRGIVRSVRRKEKHVAERAPHLAMSFSAAVDALEAAVLPATELVPSHGDFSLRNVLVGRDRLLLIDLDRVRRSDPLRDVAYLGAWSWAWDIRRGRDGDWSVLEQSVETYRSLRPGQAPDDRVAFHVAAGLLRISHGIVELWPEDLPVADRLIDEARARIA